MRLGERSAEIGLQFGKVTCGGQVTSPNQYIVEPVPAKFGQSQAGDFPQAPLGAVAGDGIADLLGTGKSDAYAPRFLGGPCTVLQCKRRCSDTPRPRRCQEIGALGQYGEAFELHVQTRKPPGRSRGGFITKVKVWPVRR